MKKNLDEISFIRPILIVLLVLYHAFAPWCGAWRPFQGFMENESYWWIGKAAYSFMLPTFVFISFYVFAFQRETLGRVEGIWVLMRKKFKRLIIPSIIFSILYLPLIPSIGGGNYWVDSILRVVDGAGHMWFLPMLFWCFPILILLFKIKYPILKFLVPLVFAVGPVLPLPLQIGMSLSYLFYAFLGYKLYKNIKWVKVRSTTQNVVILWFLFVLSFIGLTILKRDCLAVNEGDAVLLRLVKLSIGNASTLLYSTLGILAMLSSALKITTKFKLPTKIITLGTFCFGVYIFQQFILQLMYYHTAIPQYIGSELLPWVGFSIALLFSLLFSYLLRLSRVGRKLI